MANKGSEFLGGILLGAIIGTAIGLLLAPQTGEETRESIREYADDLSGKVKESSRQIVESGKDILEQGKGQATNIVKRAREQVDSLRKTAEEASEQA